MREPWLILLCSAKTMKKLLLALCAANLAWFALEAAQPVSNASHIDVYVTPYYNSKGPSVSTGRFSSGLASAKEDEFVATIGRMKKDWNQLTYPEVTFKSKSDWASANTDLADGMSKLISMLKEKKDDIRRQRIQQGIEEKFSKLTTKELTSR